MLLLVRQTKNWQIGMITMLEGTSDQQHISASSRVRRRYPAIADTRAEWTGSDACAHNVVWWINCCASICGTKFLIELKLNVFYETHHAAATYYSFVCRIDRIFQINGVNSWHDHSAGFVPWHPKLWRVKRSCNPLTFVAFGRTKVLEQWQHCSNNRSRSVCTG